jgi:hypothetical protein
MGLHVRVGLLAAVLGLVAFGLYSQAAAKESVLLQTKCDVHGGPCSTRMGKMKVRLNITPKPVKAMQELTFTLTLEGNGLAQTPYIDLGMPGMDMGRNRVNLKPKGDGTYEGSGIIVRCPSGRKTWKAKITVPDAGVVEFIFDVIY